MLKATANAAKITVLAQPKAGNPSKIIPQSITNVARMVQMISSWVISFTCAQIPSLYASQELIPNPSTAAPTKRYAAGSGMSQLIRLPQTSGIKR